MSVHRSKGLEFPVVFVPDLGKGINLDDCRGMILTDRQFGLGLNVVDQARFIHYPSLASTLVRNRLRQQAMAEELRVLYVAMTRAKEHLVMMGTASDKALDYLISRWAGHRGKFPADHILGVNSMLQWLVSVASASSSLTPAIFELHRYPVEDVAALRSEADRRAALTPEEIAIARLEPLHDIAGTTSSADRIISRLEAKYPFERFTKVPAAQSVTGHMQTSESDAPSLRSAHGAPLEKALERPAFLFEQTPISATERGTATHLVLQHLDFAAPCDEADVERQINEMIARRVMSEAEAGAVDRNALVWFLESEIGKRLKRHAGQIRREIPVYFTLDGAGVDPIDQPMIRGRLDLLLPLDDGHLIVDYKTDAVNASSIHSCADEYRPQMELYRQAIERITLRPVREVHLVFLSARSIIVQ